MATYEGRIMVCQDVEQNELVARYLSDQLESDIQDDFELHLLECRRCQSSLEVMLAARDDLVARAHEIRSYSPATSGRLRWVWVGAATVSLVLCSLGISWLMLRHPGHSQIAQQKDQAPAADGQWTPKIEGSRSQSDQLDGLHINSQMLREQGPASTGLAQKQNPNPGANSQVTVTVETLETMRAEPMPQPSTEGSAEDSHDRQVKMLPILSPTDTSGWPEEKRQQLARLAEVTPPTYTFSRPLVLNDPYAPWRRKRKSKSLGNGALAGNQSLAQSQFRTAMLAYVDKRYGDAEELLDQVVKLAPYSQDVNFYLGICKLVNGKPNEAVFPFDLVLSTYDVKDAKSPYAQEAHIYLGKAYLQTGWLSLAEIQFERAAALPGQLQADAHSIVTELQGLLATAEQDKAEKSNKLN